MRTYRFRPIELNPLDFLILLSTANTFFFNTKPLYFVFKTSSASTYDSITFTISIAIILTAILLIILVPFYIIKVGKYVGLSLLFISSIAAYFANVFGVLFDETLAKSILSTSSDEFIQYWNFKLFFYIILCIFLTIFASLKIKIKNEDIKKRIYTGIKIIFVSLIFITAFSFLKYKDISSFLRNNRHFRHMILPISPIYEFSKIIKSLVHYNKVKFVKIGTDAKKISSKKQIFILVLGETARGDHFSINGYTQNNTTPQLSKRNVTTFKNVTSCGTATAVSLPCIFSNLGRLSFSEDKASNMSNLLDVASQANYETIWIDNNTGCKGICSRSKNIDLTEFKNSFFCKGLSCYDEILVDAFKKNLQTNRDQFFVLHMLGSHGPSYYLRYPDEFEKFKPSCRTSDLSSCSKEEIINTYDNTILYTDYVLDKLIQVIEEYSKKEGINSSLLYVSDHGESLGEKGIYLHSLPYLIAPDEQKRAAIIYWSSNTINNRIVVKEDMISHDYIFSSVLNILNIKTKEYNRNLDFNYSN